MAVQDWNGLETTREAGRLPTAGALGAEPCTAGVLINICPQSVQACLPRLPPHVFILFLRFLRAAALCPTLLCPMDLNRWYIANTY